MPQLSLPSRLALETDPYFQPVCTSGTARTPPFYVCNPCVTDPSGAPKGHSTLYVLVPTLNTARDVDWAQTEAELRERIPAMLEKVGLKGVHQHIREERYFTAETWRDDFNVFRGAVFNGCGSDPERWTKSR